MAFFFWGEMMNPEKLKEILAEAGSRYRLAEPSSWPKQAKLAHLGKWDELKAYQDLLIRGRTPDA